MSRVVAYIKEVRSCLGVQLRAVQSTRYSELKRH